MNPSLNPFAPGAGTQPPELAGRELLLLEDVGVALDRIRLGRAAHSQLFVGLRGVGKTVLLNRVREIAVERKCETFLIEAREDGTLLIPPMRRLLLALDARAGVSETVKRALRVLRSFLGKFNAKVKTAELADLELGLEPEHGTADSGILETGLSDLFLAVGEAAKDRGAAVCFLLDEMQYLGEEEFSGLIVALHQINQRNLPLLMVGAGLAQILAQILALAGGRSRTRSVCLRFRQSARCVVMRPAWPCRPRCGRRGRVYQSALAEVVAQTQGYPYFLQQWAYEAWNVASSSPITSEDVQDANPAGDRAVGQQLLSRAL